MILEILAYISVGIITFSWIIALIIDFIEKMNSQKNKKVNTSSGE